eukprot:TRINITY_DN1209_c0_g1_i2.p1 TRINITY_DN1209_c0_g1~~TRINITY_DN1209_c0_g1_i2.p1  ORF type:complete len:420 (-),score=92.22 TRINITY_DN1209_c0_g1_i2:25-1284(-)
MMPLTTITNEGFLNNPDHIKWQFGKLENEGNVDGIMIDVWWGIVEKTTPKSYNWEPYKQLFTIARNANLKVQVVLSFHKCGGNVGDECYIPVPKWAHNDTDYVFYEDQYHNVDDEYLSWGVDLKPVIGGRTAVQVYTDFMENFAKAFSGILGSTITEVQVGLGPAGELRYPSYQLDKWKFPGIGEFQMYDLNIREDLIAYAKSKGETLWGQSGPNNAGHYNNWPDETGFFNPGCQCENYKSEYGQFFLNWYSKRLIEHGDRILAQAARIFQDTGADIAAKISGIHWQYKHPSHAAELTAGYKNDMGRGYKPFADMFARHGATMIFTCLEMKDNEQQNCNCAPAELVGQTMYAAKDSNIPYSGENALPRYDVGAYQQIEYETTRVRPLHAFTYLRLTDELLQNGDNWNNFKSFVGRMHNL